LPAGFPNDPRFNTEQKTDKTGFGRERFEGAWTILDDKFHFPKIGRADVRVAVLEKNISSATSEFYCAASDGLKQIELCWNATNGTNCGPVDMSTMTHGLAVLGIVAACVNNYSEIAGMAPGTKKIVVQAGTFTASSGYADLLLWIGKMSVNCPTPTPASHPCNWPPVPAAAWVINASHTICSEITNLGEDGKVWCMGTWWDLPTPINIAFKTLWQFGRNQSGVLPVYASGNAGQSSLDQSPFARSPYTIAVSNCMIDIGGGEKLVELGDENPLGWGSGSNYGKEIDICALGHKIPTIHYSAGCVSSGGGCLFGGTSAATPQVSSAIGLILSANPSLTSSDVRTILQKSADKIDAVNGAWVAGRSPKYGSGRLNVCRAIKLSLGLPDPGPYSNLCAPQTLPSLPSPSNLRTQ
jgi:hypothetical protein